MDPFSIVVGSIGVIDVCSRLVKYLREFEKSVAEIDQDIKDLLCHLETVNLVVVSIRDAFGSKVARVENATDTTDKDVVERLWKNASTVLSDCRCKIEKLEVIVKEIKGRDRLKGPSKLDGFRKQLRRQAKEEDYRSLRNDLDSFLHTLQTMLQIIDLSQSTSDQVLGDIRTLHSKIDLLKPELDSSIRVSIDSES
ncbi:hypothetical protein P7C71_g5815, partial [Lecanoromycetidae sp. Uapishka_2]